MISIVCGGEVNDMVVRWCNLIIIVSNLIFLVRLHLPRSAFSPVVQNRTWRRSRANKLPVSLCGRTSVTPPPTTLRRIVCGSYEMCLLRLSVYVLVCVCVYVCVSLCVCVCVCVCLCVCVKNMYKSICVYKYICVYMRGGEVVE